MISAIVLAAGKSRRMGRPKMLMRWGETTVLNHIVQTLRKAGIEDVIAATNSEIAPRLENCDVRVVLNDEGGMLQSAQIGLRALKPSARAALICLGDQPQMEESSARSVCEAYQKNQAKLVAPSYRLRRGHPWLVDKSLWAEILAMQNGTLRDFLNAHANEVEYVELDAPSVLQDLDTPNDYLKYKPSS
ncbi:MAG: nucleotidyltransferase family protein [Anaerolineales bacterium]|nr:nucleotidyltransferase family protein [Anaerolineales bacterium]